VDTAIIVKLAGLLIPLAGMAAPVVIVLIVLQHRARMRDKLYDTVKHFAERGMPVPRELLDPPRTTAPQATWRFFAFTLIGAGVGTALLFWSLDLVSLMGIGGLLVCVGVAQLVAWQLDRRDAERGLLPAGDGAKVGATFGVGAGAGNAAHR
jgi:Domain of unknown function (DUF6249)